MKRSLFNAAMQQLVTARESKKREIESYFDSLKKLTVSFSSNLMTKEALARFTQTFHGLERENIDSRFKVPLKRESYYCVNVDYCECGLFRTQSNSFSRPVLI